MPPSLVGRQPVPPSLVGRQPATRRPLQGNLAHLAACIPLRCKLALPPPTLCPQVGDCFIYNNAAWRLNYCVGGEVTTLHHLDK